MTKKRRRNKLKWPKAEDRLKDEAGYVAVTVREFSAKALAELRLIAARAMDKRIATRAGAVRWAALRYLESCRKGES